MASVIAMPHVKRGPFWLTRVISIILVIVGAFAVHQLLFNFSGSNEFPYRMMVFSGIFVTLAVSLNLINGITGQFSVGHAAFYMVGAYVTGILAKTVMPQVMAAVPLQSDLAKQGVWLLIVMILGALCAAVAGFVVGLPSLRLKGDYLAIVTLGFGEILRIVAENINLNVGGKDIVAGAYGIQQVPKIFDLWMVLLLAAFSIALCRNLLKTAHGLPFLSTREDEVASAAMGVDVTRVKVTAFVIGAALAGAAGALFMHYDTYASPSSFKMEISFQILTMVVLGGTGSITGSAIGAVLLYGIPEWLRTIHDKSGDSIKMTAGVVTGAVIGVVLATVAIRRLGERYHEGATKLRLAVLGAIVGAGVLAWIAGMILNLMPAFRNKSWDFTDLRWAILAMVLIIMMLLRPQGMLAHHELSLDKLFKRKPMEVDS